MKTSIVMRTDRPDTDGLFPFRMRLSYRSERKYISLDVSGEKKYWDEANQVLSIQKGLRDKEEIERNEARKQVNAYLDAQKVRARDIIEDFQRNSIDPTLTQFIDAFLVKDTKYKVSEYFKEHIKALRETGHTGNANCYDGTLHILQLFDKRFDSLCFQDIDTRYVNRFDAWLQKPRETTTATKKGKRVVERVGCSGNTRKYYHKALRALLNRAILESVGSASTYPYGKGGFEVAALEEETEKRYIPIETMQRIKSTVLDSKVLELNRRIFVAQYLCYGISFIDAALLQRSNIKTLDDGQYIVYKRQKTKNDKKVKPITIKVTDELGAYLEWFSVNSNMVDNYLFPIVTKSGYEGEKLYNHIKSRYHICNNHLKTLAGKFNITDMQLTTYVSRHTMAMTLKANGVHTDVIQQVMGHSDANTTKTYLDGFTNAAIAKATECL